MSSNGLTNVLILSPLKINREQLTVKEPLESSLIGANESKENSRKTADRVFLVFMTRTDSIYDQEIIVISCSLLNPK